MNDKPKSLPQIVDTFVVRGQYAIVLTSVDYHKREGTFRFFDSEEEATAFVRRDPQPVSPSEGDT